MDKLKSKLNYYKEIGCSLNAEEVKKILDKLENTQADLYEANNRINDLLDIVEQKDKIINELVSEVIRVIYYYENYKECKFDYEISEDITETRKNIEKYFEERCNKC